MAILTGVRLDFIVVFIFISLIINDVEHLFMCLLTISMSLKKCLFMSSSCFFFFFLVLSCISCLYVLKIKPLSVASFANIFSQPLCCLFVLFILGFPLVCKCLQA